MDIKKLLIGGIVGGIVYFGLGYLIYGNLLTGFMKNNPGTAMGVDRAMEDIRWLYLGLGNLVMGFLVAYVLLKSNATTAVSGFVIAGIVGLLFTCGYDLMMYGTTNIISKKMMAADVAASTVMTAIVGAVVAMVMNMGKKAA